MARIAQNLYQAHLSLFEQQLLAKEIAAGVGRQAQFGKDNHLHSLALGNDNQFLYL